MSKTTTTSHQLRSWRKATGLTQAAAASAVGVALGTYVRWELGLSVPRGLSNGAISAAIQRTQPTATDTPNP